MIKTIIGQSGYCNKNPGRKVIIRNLPDKEKGKTEISDWRDVG